MKEGWEYKKLGEVCDIERGGSPRPISDYITDAENGINWIKIGDAVEGSKYILSTAEKIKPEGMKKSRFVHKGDFILSNSMSFGKPYILGVDGCIHDGWLVIHDDNNTFNKDFLYYYLGSPSIYSEFKRLAVGGVVNNLNSNLVRGVKVAIPPISEQQHIVEELDLLSSIIEKKKAQIKELDNLAQSFFYEMFGDPIINDKGWKKQKWNDTLKIINGKNQKNVENVSGAYPIYGSGGIMGYATDYLCPKNTVVIGRKGNINKPILVHEPFWNVDTAFGLVSNEDVINFYYLYFFCIIFDFENLNKAVTIPSLTKKDLLDIDIPIPPIFLQYQFADRIKTIEHQKELIQKSIKEVETLFNSRMDYYFN